MAAVKRLVRADATITVNGHTVSARVGESVAAAMLAAGVWQPFYCGMGVCFVCRVTIDGIPSRRACLERVHDGMSVTLSGWEPE